MSNRRFEIFHYRQVLVRMRQGDSDREIAGSKTMGRRKIAYVREVAAAHGWLVAAAPSPEDAVLSAAFDGAQAVAARCVSSLKPWREQITRWHSQGIQGTTIHAALLREYGYTGSLPAV